MAAHINVPRCAERKVRNSLGPWGICSMPSDRYTARIERLCPRGEGGRRVKYRAVLLLLAVAMTLLIASGVAFALTVNCNGGKCRGTNDRDTMYGSNRRDNIHSLDGADLVRANGDSDSVSGDGGKDRLSGGTGNDEVFGGDDDDLVAGNKGFDTLNAGKGDDRIEAVDG